MGDVAENGWFGPVCLVAMILMLFAGRLDGLVTGGGGSAAEPGVKVQLTSGAPAPKYQEWIDAARAPVPGPVLLIDPGPCPSVDRPLACTGDGKPIYMPEDRFREYTSLTPAGREAFMRRVLMHEVGHQFDAQMMTYDARAEFARLVDRTEWSAWEGNSAAEQFAEAYAICAWPEGVARDAVRWHGKYGYEPTLDAQARMCSMIRSLGPS